MSHSVGACEEMMEDEEAPLSFFAREDMPLDETADDLLPLPRPAMRFSRAAVLSTAVAFVMAILCVSAVVERVTH